MTRSMLAPNTFLYDKKYSYLINLSVIIKIESYIA